MSSPLHDAKQHVAAVPRLPAEILANIVELAILTSSPCPLVTPSSSAGSTSADAPSPFTTPLRASYTSAWAWTGHLLHVSRFVHSVARPLLLRTLTLDRDAAAHSFFHILTAQKQAVEVLEKVERAWLGNVSALARASFTIDPVRWKLAEAAWYEECPGGFVVGHAYASRLKPKRKDKDEKDRVRDTKEKQYRSVSVYWAEEQLVEEVSDPERSSSDDDTGSSFTNSNEGQDTQSAANFATSLPSTSNRIQNGISASQRRRSHHDSASTRDPRIDRPHEPAWQTLYSRQRRSSPVRTRSQPAASLEAMSGSSAPSNPYSSSQVGPSEGDLDPWEMQDAQERLAALANSTVPAPSSSINPDPELDPAGPSTEAHATLVSAQCEIHARRRRREIYAYHLCTATLEPWINSLFSSLRALRLITLTFYPGHLLDDDKLEHMLRRILSPAECPRLQTLLIRIVFDAASAGSRLRRFERTKTIAGAVDRIGDERVRVMLVNDRVGEGELVALPRGMGPEAVSPVSRKAITLTKEGWWARVLQQNHHQEPLELAQDQSPERPAGTDRIKQERGLSNWQMFFPPSQHVSLTHLVNLIHHCDPWPDHRNPVT